MITGVVAYCLAVVQIFLGPKEDRVGTGSGEEARVEGQSTGVRTSKIQQDIIPAVGEQGECSTNDGKTDLICPMEVGSDHVKVKSGSCQKQCSKVSIEIEIPGLLIAATKSQGMRQGALDNIKEDQGTEMKTEGRPRRMSVIFVKEVEHTDVWGMQARVNRARRWSFTTQDIRTTPSGHSKIADKDKFVDMSNKETKARWNPDEMTPGPSRTGLHLPSQ